MWILGGTENYYFGDDKSLKNDVWSSADGKEWTQETANAPWSPRAYHAAVVHDGKIWVLGGGNYVPKYQALNDVWCSADGVHWEQVTDHAPVAPADLVLRGRLPRPDVGPGRLVEQPLEELGRRLVLARRQAVDAAPVERDLEGAARALRLCLPGQDLGRRRPRPAAQQRGLVAGGPEGLVHGLSGNPRVIIGVSASNRSLLSSGTRPMRLPTLLLLLALATPALALEPIPDKLVVLTFDDASKSHVTVAAPLLKKHGFGATFFVTEGFDFPTNKRDYMTWDEIAQLHRDGFEIGNHTRDHKAPSAKDPKGTIEQLEAINARCLAHGIPRPVTFAYPGNALDKDVLPILHGLGIKFARRGGAPEYPYDKGRGFAYEPGLDHPLLIPSAGDARPGWTLDDFKRAVSQAKGGKIAVIQLHGVPDTAHSWVNTPTPLFESYVKYLADNGYRVIALRDLARYVDPTVVPSNPWGVIEDRKRLLSSGRDGSNARPAKSDADLRGWLASMLVHHRYTPTEAGAALGLTADEVTAAAKRLGITTDRTERPSPSRPALSGRPPPSHRLPRRRHPAPARDQGQRLRPLGRRRLRRGRRPRGRLARHSRRPSQAALPGPHPRAHRLGRAGPDSPPAGMGHHAGRLVRGVASVAEQGHADLASDARPGRRADGVPRDQRLDRDPDRARRPDVRDAQGPERLRASVERQQGLPAPLRRRSRRFRPALDHHRVGRLQAGLGQRALPLPSLRPSCPGLPAGRVEKRQGVGVVL